jgi:hypothetical protein
VGTQPPNPVFVRERALEAKKFVVQDLDSDIPDELHADAVDDPPILPPHAMSPPSLGCPPDSALPSPHST